MSAPTTTRAERGHPVWGAIAPEITPAEFAFPYQMDALFLLRLSDHRRACGVPFRFVSDHRPPARNAAAGGVSDSAHTEVPCRAVDLRLHSSRERYLVLRELMAGEVEEVLRAIVRHPDAKMPAHLVIRAIHALSHGAIERIGIYAPTADQRKAWGKNSGSLHIDDDPERPRSVAWVT